MEQQQEVYVFDPRKAPTGVRAGRVLMWIGCIFFFLWALVNIGFFVMAWAIPDVRNQLDFGDAGVMFDLYSRPFLAMFFLFAGIGGICYLVDKTKLKRLASLAAVILVFVFLIDTVLAIRNLVHNLIEGNMSALDSWLQFLFNLLDTQITGGIYLIGWALMKDYMGD